MRQIDGMTPAEIETLRLKGMLAPKWHVTSYKAEMERLEKKLAAERERQEEAEKGWTAMYHRQAQELAAEREKVETLVDALARTKERLQAKGEHIGLIDAALARHGESTAVKEDK